MADNDVVKDEEINPEDLSTSTVKTEDGVEEVKAEIAVEVTPTEQSPKEEAKEEDKSEEKKENEEEMEETEENEEEKKENAEVKKEAEEEKVLDAAALVLKEQVSRAIKLYEKLISDLNFANRISQPNISSYTRSVLILKMNATTVHLDGYQVRIGMATTQNEFAVLLEEVTRQIRRVRELQEMNVLLGE